MGQYDNYTPEISYDDELPVHPDLSSPGDEKEKSPRKRRRQKTVATPKREPQKPESKKPETREWFNNAVAALKSPTTRIMFGILLGCVTVYLSVAFISYFTNCIKDQSVINSTRIGTSGAVGNAGGEGGARLAEFLINESFGLGSFVIIIWLGALALKILTGKPRFKTVNFTIKCLVALITISLIVGLTTIGMRTAVNWGGFHGRYVNEFIINFIGWTGAGLLCLFMVALFVAICLRDFILWIMRKKQERDRRRSEERAKREAKLELEAQIRKMQEQERIDDIKAGETTDFIGDDIMDNPVDESVDFNENDSSPIYDVRDHSGFMPRPETGSESQIDENQAATDNIGNNIADESGSCELSEAATGNDDSDKNTDGRAETAEENCVEEKMVVNVNTIDQTGRRHFKSEIDLYESHTYNFPPFDLLRQGETRPTVDAEEQRENEEKIRGTLLDFGIPIKSIKATIGPTVTLYEIVPDNGVKISKIRNLVDDIALSLSAVGVRIIAPIPGKGTVGIEVANKEPQTVSMRTVIKSKKFQDTRYALPVALGSTISNDVYIADLAKMPHLLVAGATGQGKSVGLNAIIASLLYCKKPYQLKFVLIDPKQVEFSLYNKLKDHYMAMIPDDSIDEPVITDMNQVEATLSSLCVEMDQRYSLLKSAHTRNIEEYNNKIREGKLNPAEGHKFLPYIVVVVDEFGDLIMVSGKNVEMPIARLAQKARAVGMHVIIATQRPSTNVITGIIKANFPARISFKVASGVDSKTILDTPGAQQLIGRGDMLIFNNSEMVRVQCAFIDTPEVEAICDYVGRQPYPMGPYQLPEPAVGTGTEEDSSASGSIQERDPLFEEVARQIVKSSTASTSSLQRHYSIGYNRAGKIMDQMERAGIVGPSTGGKPRPVLVDSITLESILNNE